MNIIVNASGAKFGGAKTIVETFCQWLEVNDQHNNYIFIVGFPLSTKSKNITIVELPTNGLTTLLLSSIGIIFFCIKYQSNIVFSFMNLNTIFPFINRITYFHQALLFSSDLPKFKVYKAMLAIQKKSHFFTQTPKIKKDLSRLLKLRPNDKRVSDIWPGVIIPDELKKPSWYETKNFEGNKIAICPYTSLLFEYKNFEKIYKSYSFFKKNNIKVIITTNKHKYEDNDVFLFVGNCTLPELHYLYKEADIVLFPSKHETVGLPIFEAMYHGTPVVVENADYIEALENKFPDLNFNIETNDTYSFNINSLKGSEVNLNSNCFEGEWGEVLSLIKSFRKA